MVMGKKDQNNFRGRNVFIKTLDFGLGFSLRLFRVVQQYICQFDVSLISLGH